MSTSNYNEEILYGDLAFFHTHPRHLAAVAALCGLPLPQVENCRVLEMGCGTGFNLLAMSQSLPNAQFVGVDLSEKQIQHGQQIARDIGNTRVDLRTANLTELDSTIGEFDFIIAHGLFSWVPPQVQNSILDIIQRHLSPTGIGYLSYNTYPGWNTRAILRDSMRFFAGNGSSREHIQLAKESVKHLIDTLPEKDSPYQQILRSEYASIESEADYYLLHEHLVGPNQPLSITEFSNRLTEHNLKYLCESRYGTNSFAQIGEDRTALDYVGNDLIQREQFHDLRWQRYFRQSLVVHAATQVSYTANPMNLARFWLHPRVNLVEPIQPLEQAEHDLATHEDDGSEMQIHNSMYRRILRKLHTAPGKRLSLAALHPEMVAELGADPGLQNTLRFLSKIVAKGYCEELWYLYATEPNSKTKVDEQPFACPLIRWQTQQQSDITNRLHRTTKLNDFERDLVNKLDGTKTVDQLCTNDDRDQANAALTKFTQCGILIDIFQV
jgi:SAM-dependent methyltransferase